jgi:hypothetical protein
MKPSGPLPITIALLAVLLAPLAAPPAGARIRYKPKPAPAGAEPAPCEPLAGPPPDVPPRPRDRVGLNFSSDMLLSADTAVVQVCALVDSLGLVRQASVERGGTPYDSAAVDAVHWWQFEPARRGGRPVAARASVTLTVHPPLDADPLSPDVLGMALQAEAGGRSHDAFDAWMGALARAGAHPTLGNEWVIRERIIRLAAGSDVTPAIPAEAAASARGAHDRMLRDMSRGTNADLARALDKVLVDAPWYADAYRWRASARAASGQRAGAIRDVLCYEIASRDSAGLVSAERALAALARGDTLTALTLLKK